MAFPKKWEMLAEEFNFSANILSMKKKKKRCFLFPVAFRLFMIHLHFCTRRPRSLLSLSDLISFLVVGDDFYNGSVIHILVQVDKAVKGCELISVEGE